MERVGGVVIAVAAIVCVTILAVTDHDSAALMAFIATLPSLGLYPVMQKVQRQTNGQLEAAREGSHRAGYMAGYIDATQGREPVHTEVSGIRVHDAIPTPEAD